MSTPDIVTNVRAAMIQCASRGQAFDAARLATVLNATPAQIDPAADYLFWMGALTPFRYRRQTRTGLSPLYSRFTGELPGVFVEAPPPDGRAPEAMPTSWRIENAANEDRTGVLFCNGERAAFEAERAAYGQRTGDHVRVRWRRSPTGHFNIVDSVELAEQVPGGKPAFKALARVLRLEDAPPARPTLVLVDENGVASSLPATAFSNPGDIVEVTWGLVDGASGCVPLSFRTLEQPPRRFTLGKWLAIAGQSIEEYVPDLEELAGQEALTNVESITDPDDPFAVLRAEDLHFVFSAIRAYSESEGLPEWIFEGNYDEVPLASIADALDVTNVPDFGDDWRERLNAAAAREGSAKRVFDISTGGSNYLVVVLPQASWHALVAAGVVAFERRPSPAPTSFEEARACMAASWESMTPFSTYDALLAFLVSPEGRFIKDGDDGAKLAHGELTLTLAPETFGGETWAVFGIDSDDAILVDDFAARIPGAIRIGDDTLTIAVPVGFVSPTRARRFIEELISTRREAIELRK